MLYLLPSMDKRAHLLHLFADFGGGRYICPSLGARVRERSKHWRMCSLYIKHAHFLFSRAEFSIDGGGERLCPRERELAASFYVWTECIKLMHQVIMLFPAPAEDEYSRYDS